MMLRMLVPLALSFLCIALSSKVDHETDSTSLRSQISDSEKDELIDKLLSESLRLEIETIKTQINEANYDDSRTYLHQMKLRSRLGKYDQVENLSDAVNDRNEAKNVKQNSLENHGAAKYVNRIFGSEAVLFLIQKGELERASKLIDDPNRLKGQQWYWGGMRAQRFWLVCKIAAAHHRAGNPVKVRETLNAARKMLEGDAFSGKQFDEDNEWIPKFPNQKEIISQYGLPRSADTDQQLSKILETEFEFGLVPYYQHRATFYWTLVQSGHAELGIKWFLQDDSMHDDKVLMSSETMKQKFIEAVAKHYSLNRASEIASKLYGESIPFEVHTSIVNATISEKQSEIASTHIEAAIKLVAKETTIGYPHFIFLKSLIDRKQIEFATTYLREVLRRIEKHEKNLRAGKEINNGVRWNISIYATLALQAARIDQDTAMELVELHQNTPNRKKWDDWVEIESTKAMCKKISKEKHDQLTSNWFAKDLIKAYIDSDQMELAQKVIEDASVRVSATTESGAWTVGEGLAVLSANSFERVVLARLAVQFEKYDLARKLLEGLESNYDREECYRAVTLRIAKLKDVDRAKSWIEKTKHPVSKAGAMLGLVEFLAPKLEVDDIPRVYVNNGC